MTLDSPNRINPMIRHRASHIGRSVARREDRSPLMGRRRYVADLRLPGMLEVADSVSGCSAAEREFSKSSRRSTGGLRAASAGAGPHTGRSALHGRSVGKPKLGGPAEGTENPPLDGGPTAVLACGTPPKAWLRSDR